MSSSLSSSRWKTLEPLIDAAVELPAAQRRAFADQACGADLALREELEELLSAYDRKDTLFDRPAAERFLSLIEEGMSRLPAVLNDRYRIERELGRGGMATVYLARDLRHERNVAVKVLNPELTAAVGAERFLAEIRTTAQLHHPNILPLHDSGEVDGFLFYVVPYVEGGSLRQRLEREHQLPVDDAVRIAREVASALDAAHRNGVIHRDIKPENILLHDGTALVADFGIALAVSQAAPRLTQSGLALGTPQYMSPEQSTGAHPIDARSDVYALGSVVYEMLAGEPPFTGATAVAVMAKRAVMPAPPVRILRPALSAAMDASIARALARESVDRYRTAAEFVGALDASLARPHAEVAASPSRGARRRRPYVALAGAAAIAAITLVALYRVGATTRLVGREPATRMLALSPFHVRSNDTTLSYLREGMIDLLWPKLSIEGLPRPVVAAPMVTGWFSLLQARGHDPSTDDELRLAEAAGASSVVVGSVVSAGEELTMDAAVMDVRTKRIVASAEVSGARSALPVLIDRLAAQLLSFEPGADASRAPLFATTPLSAVRAYAEGRAAFRAGNYRLAVNRFEAALGEDSTFATAALDLSRAAAWTGDHRVNEWAQGVAWRGRDRLSAVDRAFLEAFVGPTYPGPTDMRARVDAWERVTRLAPDQADAWFELGDQLFHAADLLGDSAAREQTLPALETALARDSMFAPALLHALQYAARVGDTIHLRRFATRTAAVLSSTGEFDFARWRAAVALRAPNAVLRAIRARFDSLDTRSLMEIALASLSDGVAIDDGNRALVIAQRHAAGQADRVAVLLARRAMELAEGHPSAAMRALASLAEEPNGRQLAQSLGIADAILAEGDRPRAIAALNALRRILEGARTRVRPEMSTNPTEATEPNTPPAECLIGQWDAWQGHAGAARSAAADLRRVLPPITPRRSLLAPRSEGELCATVLETWSDVAQHLPRAVGTLAQLDSILARGQEMGTFFESELPLIMARLFEAVGDQRGALRAIRRRGYFYRWPYYRAEELRQEGRLCEALGDRDGAAAAYRTYLALRVNVEPEVTPEVAEVRAGLLRVSR